MTSCGADPTDETSAKMPLDWHHFDRALLVFLSQTELKANFFIYEFIELEGDPHSPAPLAYTKALWGILKHAQTLRTLLLQSANYMTDEERARLLDTSWIDEQIQEDG